MLKKHNFSQTKRKKKSRFRELSTKETQKGKCHTDSDKKAAPKRGIETV